MSDEAFWAGVEIIETDYIADCDRARFKRRMRCKGFDADTIADRLDALDDSSSHFSGRPAPTSGQAGGDV